MGLWEGEVDKEGEVDRAGRYPSTQVQYLAGAAAVGGGMDDCD